MRGQAGERGRSYGESISWEMVQCRGCSIQPFNIGSAMPFIMCRVLISVCLSCSLENVWATRESQKYRVGSRSLLQGIFLTQGLNLGLSHYRQILLTSEPSGKPISYFGCLLFLIDCTLWVICSILNCFLKIVCTIWESSCILRKLENSYVYVQITLQVICDINEE